MAQTKRRFDATWLPFGMMIGIAVGIGTGMILLESLFLGAIAGMLLGLVIGLVLGFTPRRGEGTAEEAEDAYVRQQESAREQAPPQRTSGGPEDPTAPEGPAAGGPQGGSGRGGPDGRS